MAEKTFKYIFGPVPSRRLGRSLGVDLVPLKTCPFDCIYCQVGRTTNRTIERKEYVPFDDVLSEIKQKLNSKPLPDFITFSGSGEPTLYSRIGELITKIKAITEIPVAVLTNGALLWEKEVQDDLLQADVVVPSLDAGDEETFQRANRPHPEITYKKLVDGLVEFRKRFSNQLWLEVFLIEGITGKISQVEKIISHVRHIKPDRVQLNTVTRPPAEHFAVPLTKEEMHKFAEIFGKNAEVIADYSHVHEQKDFAASRKDVVNLLKRRPCSLEDIIEGLAIHRNEALKHLEHLLEEGSIKSEAKDGKLYYLIR